MWLPQLNKSHKPFQLLICPHNHHLLQLNLTWARYKVNCTFLIRNRKLLLFVLLQSEVFIYIYNVTLLLIRTLFLKNCSLFGRWLDGSCWCCCCWHSMIVEFNPADFLLSEDILAHLHTRPPVHRKRDNSCGKWYSYANWLIYKLIMEVPHKLRKWERISLKFLLLSPLLFHSESSTLELILKPI